jgi:hypothetical protein
MTPYVENTGIWPPPKREPWGPLVVCYRCKRELALSETVLRFVTGDSMAAHCGECRDALDTLEALRG